MIKLELKRGLYEVTGINDGRLQLNLLKAYEIDCGSYTYNMEEYPNPSFKIYKSTKGCYIHEDKIRVYVNDQIKDLFDNFIY